MGYIIVWKANRRDPFIQTDSHYFKDEYSSYDEAKEAAQATLDNEGPKSKWYYDYAIYEEVTS